MVKFKWPSDKIQIQRVILLSIIGMISFGILKGHKKYEREVSEYMNSLEYRRAREAAQEYSVQRMKRNQRLITDSSGEPSSSDIGKDKSSRWNGKIW